MQFQTGMTADLAEMGFRSVVSSITATSTVSDLQAGEPLILLSGASGDGIAVSRALTATTVTNNLWVGNAHASIAHEGVGLAQCYGIDDDLRLLDSVTAAAGQILIPQVNSTKTQVVGGSCVTTVAPLYGSAATGTAANAAIQGLTGLAVAIAAATAVTATDGSSTITAHLRLL